MFQKTIALVVFAVLLCSFCVGCGSEITGQGFHIIDDDGTNVTYHLKCTECGRIYPEEHIFALYEGVPLKGELMCDYCFKVIDFHMARK